MRDRSIRLRLNDIIRATDGAAATIGSSDFETFRTVYHMPRTIERCIEIVSEASRHLPADIKSKYPNIPWQPIAGIGNVLRHDYDLVDERIIWEVATVHFPELRQLILENEITPAGRRRIALAALPTSAPPFSATPPR